MNAAGTGVEPGSVTTATAVAALSRAGERLVSARQGLSGAAQVTWTGEAARSYGSLLDELVLTLARLGAALDDARSAVVRHLHAADDARHTAQVEALACPTGAPAWPAREPGIVRLPNGVPVLDLPVTWSGPAAQAPAPRGSSAGDPR